jgi:hypothetical protein
MQDKLATTDVIVIVVYRIVILKNVKGIVKNL